MAWSLASAVALVALNSARSMMDIVADSLRRMAPKRARQETRPSHCPAHSADPAAVGRCMGRCTGHCHSCVRPAHWPNYCSGCSAGSGYPAMWVTREPKAFVMTARCQAPATVAAAPARASHPARAIRRARNLRLAHFPRRNRPTRATGDSRTGRIHPAPARSDFHIADTASVCPPANIRHAALIRSR